MSQESSSSPTRSQVAQSDAPAIDEIEIAKRNKEVERYLPLIRKVVGRLMLRFPPLIEEQDMVAVGVLGLIDALARYQPGALSFQQYAEIRIRGAVLDELRRADFFSRGMRRKARQYQEAIRQLQNRLGVTPSLQEVADLMQMTLSEAEELRKQVQPMHFLEVDSIEVSSEAGSTKQDRGPSARNNPYEQTQRSQLRGKVRGALENLPERQRMILHLYYFEDQTMRGIGEMLGLSESRICQIHRKACQALKHSLDIEMTDLVDLF
jgi:RNA polymerase sigma factor for flagellar operon FliA